MGSAGAAAAPTPARPLEREREGPASAGGWGLAQSLLLYDLALLCFNRLFGNGIDPPGIQANGVFGGDGGPPVLVPIGHAKRCDVVMGDYVIAVLQYPVERAAVSDKARPIV